MWQKRAWQLSRVRSSFNGHQFRHISRSAPLAGLRTPQFTEEQIKEISRYDQALARQIRTARDLDLSVSWKELESMPMASYEPPPQASKVKLMEASGFSGIIKAMKDKLLGASKEKK
mmetsp:Transcript_25565/g.56367  ORF Transcript_25565/g.56367 Transcript_25565/m.56367 type:complete len:117 (-) Transcript_25565:93-443(-)